MNRLISDYRWLLGLGFCLPFIIGPVGAQQGNELLEGSTESLKHIEGSANIESQEGSNWHIDGSDLEELDGAQDAKTVKDIPPEPEQATRSNVISDAQLRRDVDQAYDALTKALEDEDSFSAALGEHYLAYGNILLKAGQPIDARKAFVNALHIQKVNEGIYDLQQRYILKSIFDTHYALDEPDKYEDTLRRIIWLEDKNDGYKDDLTYDMLLKVGNANIDLFLRKPSASELAQSYLSKAKRYLRYAIRRFDDVSLKERKLPFGELALVSLLQGMTVPRVQRSANDRFAGFGSTGQQNRKIALGEHNKASQYHAQEVHLGGDQELRQYFLKAKAENNQSEMVHALLNLGDMAQLFQRSALAQRYYRSAWESAQKLAIDDPLRTQMANPVQLPAFNYAMHREHIERRLPTKLIPMSFDVQQSGKSTKVLPMAGNSEYVQYYKAARRALRKLTFRPAIIDGEVVRTSLSEHEVRVMYDPSEEKEKLKVEKQKVDTAVVGNN